MHTIFRISFKIQSYFCIPKVESTWLEVGAPLKNSPLKNSIAK
jgi:hypothetical protein